MSVVAVQALTRDGFDRGRATRSACWRLASWIQVINFIGAAVLSLIFAGVAGRLEDGPGSIWASRLLAFLLALRVNPGA